MPTISELEEVEGEVALSWVKQQNARTLQQLQDAEYETLRSTSLKIYEAKDKLPCVSLLSDNLFYNHWQDDQHVQGLWRRTSITEFMRPDPNDIDWEILLDIDKLSAEENTTWVFHGANVLEPDCDRALISLSPGGSDAVVVREFHIPSKKFIHGGFMVPEAKTDVDWLDQNTVLIASELGPNSLTDSSYPNKVKIWRRNHPLLDATTIFNVGNDHIAASFSVISLEDGSNFIVLIDQIDFYRQTYYALDARSTQLLRLNVPEDALINAIFENRLILSLRTAWNEYPSGSIVAVDLNSCFTTDPIVELIKAPTAEMSIQGADATRGGLIVQVTENVRNALYYLKLTTEGWQETKLDYPANGSLSFGSTDVCSDSYIVEYEDDITPPTLFLGFGNNKVGVLRSQPHRFDSSKLVTAQWHATSKDGTKIPYTIVYQKSTVFDGSNATLLYGYGGFEDSQVPAYGPVTGRIWYDGNVYVTANIRGGGEFGPEWHKAALKTKRQVAFNDFIAVAEDLIARRVTTPDHLGIRGGSNGGLLVAAVLQQRPDLFKAVVCNVPLIDMLRYHELKEGAGASWMGEYGDPNIPEERAALAAYSPLHNIRPASEQRYPTILLTTSTKDDRVHPAHARWYADALQRAGHSVLYYENTEGGHCGSANYKQRATEVGLLFRFLREQLDAKPYVESAPAADSANAAVGSPAKVARLESV